MYRLVIGDTEIYNDKTNEFKTIKGQTICLEHSLLSISKWESKWLKPFISKKEKTMAETIDYIKCMTINSNVDDRLYNLITQDQINKIFDYINNPMTATTISNMNMKNSREIVTSEVIYYFMFSNQIPKECEKWHLNRLMMLIQVFGAKNQNPKKMSRNELARRNKSLNAARKAASGSRG